MSRDESKSSSVFHRTAYFSGRVQGVGFRYQTVQVAKGFDVTGFVKNLPDGRVLLEAEGTEKEVEAFFEEVQDQLGSYIRNVEKKDVVQPRKMSGFSIK